jgi:hypothetical protein
MERRDLLRAMASATALTILPHKTLEAWSRVASGAHITNGLNEGQMALVRAVADVIIPRTDTPSATDVGVHQFIDVIVAEQASEEDRTKFLAGLDAIDMRALRESNAVVAKLSAEAQGALVASLESAPRNGEAAQTYWRLKGLVVHGYLTSEEIMTTVLRHQVMPGKFDGAAPLTIKKRPLQAGNPTQRQQEEHPHG